MTPVAKILESPISERIWEQARARLTGRANACALNAMNYLVRADKIAQIAPTVSFFCATHATEEAVACAVSAAKSTHYGVEAGRINLRNHLHKVTVAQFAQMLSGRAQDHRISIGVSDLTERLAFITPATDENEEKQGIMSLRLFSFNIDGDDPDGRGAFDFFSSFFPDKGTMARHIKKRADYRNDALYAKDQGAPAMSEEQLFKQLDEHALLTLGMIWAAVDMTYHTSPEPFVLQILSAINSANDTVKREKVCPRCGDEMATST